MDDERKIHEDASTLNLTLPQAAEALGVSLATARRLVRAGKLRAIKVQGEDRARWEIPANAIEEFKLNPEGERASHKSSERKLGSSERYSKAEMVGFRVDPVLMEAHLEALKLVGTLQEKYEASQRRAEQAERALMPLVNQLEQYQRSLAENAESLAEERSQRLEAESKATEARSHELKLQQLPDVEPKTDRTQRRRGWGQKVRGWLLGEKTG